MKNLVASGAFAISLFVASAAMAAEQTVTLSIENMYCASCPYIVKQSLTNVSGVTNVDISFENKTARVTFDDSKTFINELTKATTEQGYPSALVQQGG
ncbi:MAG: mercury resistance system periplasmic binding protein MerP [Magnetovibrio sp.]|nr:mercury resistance system periplasmic binding protein MerP [Magnetovibrio sp.]